MKHAFYITCFNHPEMARRLIDSGMLSRVNRDQWDVILWDQSDDEPAAQYAALALEHGMQHVRNPNGGATECKLSLIEDAQSDGRERLAQISEDFTVAAPGQARCGWLASGEANFFAAAQAVLDKRPEVAFCNWTMAMGSGSHFWYPHESKINVLSLHKVTDLPHLEGGVTLMGWPYTARVAPLARWVAYTRLDMQAHGYHPLNGGETVLAAHSKGHGASLLAQPVIHDRKPHERPATRRP